MADRRTHSTESWNIRKWTKKLTRPATEFIFKFQANNKNGQVSALTDCVFKTYFKVSSGRQVLECDKWIKLCWFQTVTARI